MPYRNIEDPAKLRRLLEAVLQLEGDLSLPDLLRHFVEEARSMTGAQYGALGVLNEQKTALAQFITVGIDRELEMAIGPRPTGRGVLGLLIADPRPLRLPDIREHSDSFGFPPNHPPMKSFLGVPVTSHDEVYGNLYLTDKIGWSEFTKDDEDLVRALAVGAGIAIENARLHAKVQESAVFEDRDRIARDLHDLVIQRLFAIGLSLQGLSVSASNPGEKERLGRAVAEIDETIRQIRSSIFELSAPPLAGARASILALVRELSPVLGVEAKIEFDGPVDTVLAEDQLGPLLATLRELLTNVAKHAQASEVRVRVEVDAISCTLTVSDNGTGFQPPASGDSLGLTNLRHRAEELGGTLTLEQASPGTIAIWRLPIARS